jgi:hypothetical protein
MRWKIGLISYFFLTSCGFAADGEVLERQIEGSLRKLCAESKSGMDANVDDLCNKFDKKEKKRIASIKKPPQNPTTETVLRRDTSQSFEGLDHRYKDKLNDSPGASVSATQDYLKSTESYSGQAYASVTSVWTIDNADNAGTRAVAVGLGPWVYGTGTLQQPINKQRPALSAVQVGIQGQAEVAFADDVLPDTFLSLGAAPYYQTDWAGNGEIYGFRAQIRPTNQEWNLDSRKDDGKPQFATHVISLVGEADFVHVMDAGFTNYQSDTDYAWLGGSAQLRMTFLHNMEELPSWLSDRFYAIGSAQIFRDIYSGAMTRQYQAEFGYKLQGDSQNSQTAQTTIAVTYTHGEDHSLIQKVDQAKLSLTFKQ